MEGRSCTVGKLRIYGKYNTVCRYMIDRLAIQRSFWPLLPEQLHFILPVFGVRVVCEWFGMFYPWDRRTKVRNYGAFALSKPLDGMTRVR